MLGAIESLLSAVIADGMTDTKHDPNSELVALGIGNIVAPFFGGIAATGALARTATNIRAGARSPFAAVTHALVVLVAMLALAPLIAYVPMASLAALLVFVAWNMSELHNFVGIVRVAPKSDVIVLLTCFLLTVVFDMVVAVSVGFVLAALLFMRRMSELTESRLRLDSSQEGEPTNVPKGARALRDQRPAVLRRGPEGAARARPPEQGRVQGPHHPPRARPRHRRDRAGRAGEHDLGRAEGAARRASSRARCRGRARSSTRPSWRRSTPACKS